MNMKTFLSLALTLLISTAAFTQSYSVPEDYEFKTEKDYDKYEDDILKCVDWLMNTPIHKYTKKRGEAYQFLVEYVEGSPKIEAMLNLDASPYLRNPHLLVIYLASWTKSCLTQNYVNNIEEFTLRATDDVMKYYANNKKYIGKVKKMKKFEKMEKKGTLHAYVKSKL